jgi:hypothetical protein
VITLDGVDWEATGLVSIQEGPVALPPGPGPQFTVVPTGDNAFWGLLESGDPVLSPPGGVAAGGALGAYGGLEQFFGMTNGYLTSQNYVSGSGMKRDFTLAAGDVVSFDFSFVTSEPDPNDPFFPGQADAAMFVLDGEGDVIHSTPLLNGAVGTQVLNYDAFMAMAAGTYQIGVAVLNKGDSCCSSYLGVDDFRVNDAPVEGLVPVPEPGTLLLLSAGWGTAFVSRRFFAAPKKRAA